MSCIAYTMCAGHENSQLIFLMAESTVYGRSYLLTFWICLQWSCQGHAHPVMELGMVLKQAPSGGTWNSFFGRFSLMVSYHPRDSVNIRLLKYASHLSPIKSLFFLIPSWHLFLKAWTQTHLLLIALILNFCIHKVKEKIFPLSVELISLRLHKEGTSKTLFQSLYLFSSNLRYTISGTKKTKKQCWWTMKCQQL